MRTADRTFQLCPDSALPPAFHADILVVAEPSGTLVRIAQREVVEARPVLQRERSGGASPRLHTATTKSRSRSRGPPRPNRSSTKRSGHLHAFLKQHTSLESWNRWGASPRIGAQFSIPRASGHSRFPFASSQRSYSLVAPNRICAAQGRCVSEGANPAWKRSIPRSRIGAVHGLCASCNQHRRHGGAFLARDPPREPRHALHATAQTLTPCRAWNNSASRTAGSKCQSPWRRLTAKEASSRR